ncbi:MAG: nucleotide exchange factor GrpE [Marinilabiliales bacterium]|nr:nucleotide exchange factor GrpE [Marinilabiliales bacterium]
MKKKEEKKGINEKEKQHTEPITTEVNGENPSATTTEQEESVNVNREAELEIKISELNLALASANDKYLRLSAEFDNFRKRTLKEKMDLMKNASESVMVSFLPVIDDMERAMNALASSGNIETTTEGMNLIYNKFKDFTKQNGVVEMEAFGLPLDTDLHEAITKIPAPSEEQKGKIVDVIQKGYLLNDKVIRFAKVVIGE